MPGIREAHADDLPSIQKLLTENDLRTEGILEAGTAYWVAELHGEIIGAIGLELGEHSVLLRSAVVVQRWRGHGIGGKLTCQALRWAQLLGYRQAYCFSTEAGAYWISQGFSPCPVQDVIDALPAAPQIELFRQLGWLPDEGAFQVALL